MHGAGCGRPKSVCIISKPAHAVEVIRLGHLASVHPPARLLAPHLLR